MSETERIDAAIQAACTDDTGVRCAYPDCQGLGGSCDFAPGFLCGWGAARAARAPAIPEPTEAEVAIGRALAAQAPFTVPDAQEMHAFAIASALAAARSTEPEWRPIDQAPKDGTLCLLKLRTTLPLRQEWLAGICFVARHPGLAGDGFDSGWNFAAPVGFGGIPDEWIAGFVLLNDVLPSPPKET